MDKNTKKVLCFSALDQMQRRLKTYEMKGNPNHEYLQKSYGYLKAITDYINDIETEIVDLKFNQDILVISDNTNANSRLRLANKRIKDLEAMIESVGIDIQTQRFMMPDLPEMKRQNSINQAKAKWPELY